VQNSCGRTCEGYRTQATFYTDQYDAYTGVIPAERHQAITKDARKTHHIERSNNTLRQRASRLVRDTLAFSKKLANHIGAIKYFHIPSDLVVDRGASTVRGACPFIFRVHPLPSYATCQKIISTILVT
jgi:insertion element IS1 protein InsB